MNNIFLYREKYARTKGVKYIDYDMVYQTNYIVVTGPDYRETFEGDVDYDEVETVLTRKEYESLSNHVNKIDLDTIMEKIQNIENAQLIEKICEDEMTHMAAKWDISLNDVHEIISKTTLGYFDREIISCVYNDTYELGWAYAVIDGMENKYSFGYIDYDEYGECVLDTGNFVKLKNGKIVELAPGV